ncbi:hypothetical protein MRX96_055047 [Rhipicephalus microplus]
MGQVPIISPISNAAGRYENPEIRSPEHARDNERVLFTHTVRRSLPPALCSTAEAGRGGGLRRLLGGD